MADQEMSLHYAFPDPSPSFVNGFEAGRIAQRMDNGEREIDCGYEHGFPVHTDNLEVLRRMAAAEKYYIEVKNAGVEGWTAVRFRGDGAARPSLFVVRP